MESEVFVEELDCQLTGVEVLQRGQAAARIAYEIDQKEAELDRTKKAHKVAVGQLEAQQKTLQREVRTGKTQRPVKCVEQADYESGFMNVVRIDTAEIVRSRPLTEKERQVDWIAREAKEPEREVPVEGRPDSDPPAE